MDKFLNDIISNPNSTQETIALAKEWLTLERKTSGGIYNENVTQILSSNWEQDILLG